MLAFVPQNLKPDGNYHGLKVTVKKPVEAAAFAARRVLLSLPKNFADPAQQAKQEIEDAVFSQEEVRNLPVNMHTQFFKARTKMPSSSCWPTLTLSFCISKT